MRKNTLLHPETARGLRHQC